MMLEIENYEILDTETKLSFAPLALQNKKTAKPKKN